MPGPSLLSLDAPAGRRPWPRPSRRLLLVLAFAAIYVIWGSTYFAIRVAVDSFPPFLMAGSRFLVAGAALFAWARWRGAPAPTSRNWRGALVVGGLLLLGGNGIVTWSEQWLDSGLTALIVATVPLWMALFASLGAHGHRPPRLALLGLALGFAGAALLVAPWGGTTAGGAPLGPMLVLLLGPVCWAAGSVHTPRAGLPPSPQMATAIEMLAGGALLAGVGLATGEPARLDLAAVTPAAWLAWVYLILFGSLVAFTAYVWLLSATTPARVATYAYVNPVVAVLLGWAFLGEVLTERLLLAAPLIVLGVMLTVTARDRHPAAASDPEEEEPAVTSADAPGAEVGAHPARPARPGPGLPGPGAAGPLRTAPAATASRDDSSRSAAA
jgi:drug/metabolite transporter (DMT)-like permease